MRWVAPTAGALAMLATGSCDALEKLAKKRHAQAKSPPVAAPVAPAPADQCAEGWKVALDEPSFAPAAVNAGRLDALAEAAAAAASDSADRACADGKLDPDKARAVERLVLADTDDNGTPLFRLDGDTVRIEWDYTRRDLALPEAAEWRAGLICSIDPESEECPHESPAQ